MYLVTKKFYCPIRKRYVACGEKIEIESKHVEGYLFFVEEIAEKLQSVQITPNKGVTAPGLLKGEKLNGKSSSKA